MPSPNRQYRVRERDCVPGGIYRSQVPPAAHLTGTKEQEVLCEAFHMESFVSPDSGLRMSQVAAAPTLPNL